MNRARSRLPQLAGRAVLPALLLMAFVLQGCGSSTGDFGRVKTDYWTATTWPLLSQAAVAYRGEP